ncbi:MAG: anti-phage-associated DUF1156 domain-containing protein [Thermomicrobiales bacterium]
MTTTPLADLTQSRLPLDPEPRAFIEVQFPVSKLSKESYKERKAAAGQTLTALGKWWGRKPLVLVRAIILGLLMPATGDPEQDREIFLSLMTMDDEGFLRRLKGSIPARAIYDLTPAHERTGTFVVENGKPKWRPGLSAADRRRLQIRALRAMSYDQRLAHCKRPEEIDGPSTEAWAKINAHLGTHATSLPELVRELGERRFGHVPRVGDAFCGGGSIPFEAARIGCDAYASDLNPVAGLLTWGALNIIGGGEEVVERVSAAQRRVFAAVRKQVDEWGIERNEEGWIADAYLYCNDVLDPATGWRVPLAPSWVVATKTNVIARLIADPERRWFDIEIVENVTAAELAQAAAAGTWSDGVRCPVDRDGTWLSTTQRQITSAEQIRGRDGLRRWENNDLVPRPEDIFQERLYCIRWVNPQTGERRYATPTTADLDREARVLSLLKERFADWQAESCIPSRRIEPGDKTAEPIRTRGWTYWHHLFNPRQLLTNATFLFTADRLGHEDMSLSSLAINKVLDWNSRLTRWKDGQGGGIGGSEQTFYNQALNTLANYGCRPTETLERAFLSDLTISRVQGNWSLGLADARAVRELADIWITDPGYGDAVRYDEISEYFLAWWDKHLPSLFPGWYAESKRALCVKGEGERFRLALAECYANLARQMPDDGLQVVMFTHQDPEVWADVGLTLWAAGLQVSSAWTIATETPTSGIKGGGNYVQGTVVLVLRKRTTDRRGDLSDLYPDIQAEVQRQMQSMLDLDDKEDPNFGDADYQLAAYAAALRVLTGYAVIDEIDVEQELRRPRTRGEVSPLAKLIGQAVRIASDYLVPNGLSRDVWRKLTPEERLYLKGIETEAGGEAREGVYQELARGYGAGPHRELYASRAANNVRFKTPTELGNRDLRRLGDPGFPGSLLRQLLFAVATAAADPERDPRAARTYLRQELRDYWTHRLTLVDLLGFLVNTAEPLPHWRGDVEAARLLRDSIEHDAV